MFPLLWGAKDIKICLRNKISPTAYIDSNIIIMLIICYTNPVSPIQRHSWYIFLNRKRVETIKISHVQKRTHPFYTKNFSFPSVLNQYPRRPETKWSENFVLPSGKWRICVYFLIHWTILKYAITFDFHFFWNFN